MKPWGIVQQAGPVWVLIVQGWRRRTRRGVGGIAPVWDFRHRHLALQFAKRRGIRLDEVSVTMGVAEAFAEASP